MIQTNNYKICTNEYADSFYRFGTLLMQPFLHQLNLITRLGTLNLTPGKPGFSHVSLPKKTWKILKFSTVFSLVIPAFTCGLAGLGLSIRFVASYWRPEYFILNNEDMEFMTAEDEISICTYNIQGMPKYISNTKDTRSLKKRLKEITEAFNADTAPDILCLQECFSLEVTKTLCEHLQEIYPNLVYAVAPRELGFNSGLLIASKMEITRVDFQRFDRSKREDSLANKGILGVTLKVNGDQNINLYTTHFQAIEGEKYEEIRDAQYDQMLAFAGKDRSAPSLFTGDFNRDLPNVSMKCSEPTFYDIKRPRWGGLHWNGDRDDELGVIDHIFFDEEVDFFIETIETKEDMERGETSGMSDHLPVWATIKLKEMLDSA